MKDFKVVALSDLTTDPNQPRKFFDKVAMDELALSIKDKGVLQPILIRPNGTAGKFMVVCGERRFRASAAAGVTDIPAVIRDLTDDEALDMQITENLQRKDVHPMEEAIAVKSLFDAGKNVEEVAARLGKSDFYVRQRVKLCALSAEWQKTFFENRMSIAVALKVALFNPTVQKELFKTNGNDKNVVFGSWTLSKYSGSLKNAPFDLNDATIDKKAGACNGCQFNSATALLFSDAGVVPTCSNLSCFKNKTDLSFAIEFEKSTEDPAIVFVSHEYSDNYSDKWTNILKKKGINWYSRPKYETDSSPTLDTFDEWVEYCEGDDEFDGLSQEQRLEKYKLEEVAEYEAKMATYLKGVDSGKLKKAFVLTGSERGKYIYVTLKKGAAAAKGKAGATAAAAGESTVTAEDLKDEIAGIKSRQKRAAELDMERVHVVIRDKVKAHEALKKPGLISNVERGIMVHLLIESGGYNIKSFLSKCMPKLPKPKGDKWVYDVKYFNELSLISNEYLSLLVRHLAYEKYGTRNLSYGVTTGDTTMFLMANYLNIDTAKIKAEQDAIAAARIARADARIKSLNNKIAELKKPKAKEPAAATPAPAKKAAVKKKAVPVKKKAAKK